MVKSDLMEVGTMGYDWPDPAPDVPPTKKRVTIKLNPTTGVFTMVLRKEVVDLLGCQAELFSRDLATVKSDYERKIADYKIALRNLLREKVIVVLYRRRRPGAWGDQDYSSWSHDRLPRAIVGLEYEVLLKVGKYVYSQQFETAPLHHEGSASDGQYRRVIPWTEEAEAFFENMVASMDGLMARLDGFIRAGDLAANVQLAIASGGGLPALAAPQP